MRAIWALFLLIGLALPALAQEGFLPEFVEQQLSGDGRYVRLIGVSGLLSSKATVAEITIADDTGVWLRITDAQIDWRRADLFSGKLTVNSLTAASIDVLRRPQVSGELPTLEARAWAIPELPIAVDIGTVSIGELRFDKSVFGLQSVLKTEGSMKLVAGSLTAALVMVRLDGQGGDARLSVSYQKVVDLFDVSLNISEPEQGVIANALNIEGRPSVALSLEGHGPVGSLDVVYDLDTDGVSRASGQVFLRRGEDGLAFTSDFSAELATLVPPKYQAIFDGPVTGKVSGVKTAVDWKIDAIDVSGAGLTLSAAGRVANREFDGFLEINSDSLARFSQALGTDVGGSGSLRLRGKIAPLAGSFDLALEGLVDGLVPGQSPFARLLRGQTALSGRVMRDAGGLRADQLRLRSSRVDAVIDGVVSSTLGDLQASLDLVDLADLGGPISGAGKAVLQVKGSNARFGLAGTITVRDALIFGRRMQALDLGLNGEIKAGEFDGRLDGAALLQGRKAHLAADVAVDMLGIRLQAIDGSWAGMVLAGNVNVAANGLAKGLVSGSVGDVTDLARVFGFNLKGSVERFEISASDVGDKQSFAAEVAALQLDFAGVAFRDVKVFLADNRFAASAGGFDDTNFSLAGHAVGSGRLVLDAATASRGASEVALKAPVEVAVGSDGFNVAKAVLQSGSGEAVISGRFGKVLDATLDFTAFPVAAAALALPEQGLAGLVSGQVALGGSLAMPMGDFDLSIARASHALSARFGLPLVDLVATGSFSGAALDLRSASVTGTGIAVRAMGLVPFTGDAMALDVEVAQLELAGFDQVLGRQGISGETQGKARVTGALRDPDVAFDLSGQNLSLAALRSAGIGDFRGDAKGRYIGGVVALDRAELRGPTGLGVNVLGTASLVGGPLALSISGDLPLALANAVFAARGAQVQGRMSVSAQVGGTVKAPDVSGNVSIDGGGFSDSASNLRLDQVALAGRFDGQSLTITSASAESSAGGSMEISGSLGFGNGLVPDISMRLNDLAYADGRTVATRLSGNLALRGPLQGGAVLSGALTLGETQVVIPQGSGTNSGGALLEVRHRGQGPRVQATLDRVAANAARPGVGIASNVRVDISVAAPGRIFVRGRGLDSELRGSLQVTGFLGDVVPVGSFEMVRGRLAILGQRFDFREGQVTLEGNMDPVLNFRAETQSGDVTVIVTISGSASDPSVVFSSLPELPQDEVIALLIFNRGLGELSPFQLVQLASAVRELNGGRDNGLFAQIRNAAGLDDLDIQTDADGSAVVKAGKYIEENIYLELEAGSKGTTRATINLDLSNNVTAKASAGSDGESGVGVFYERDY